MTTPEKAPPRPSLLQRVLPTFCAGLLVTTVLSIGVLVLDQRRQIAELKETLPKPVRLPLAKPAAPPASAASAKSDLASIEPQTEEPPAAEAAPPPEAVRPAGHGEGLHNFLRALAELETGIRKEPVTILHIGDSHVAGDHLTRGLRRRFQDKFGDAGRGFVAPPHSYKSFAANGMTSEISGFAAANSSEGATGAYGLAGTRLTARTADARIVVGSAGEPFDFVEVRYLRSPAGGHVRLTGGVLTSDIDTGGEGGIEVQRLEGRFSQVTIAPMGTGEITVLGIVTGRNRTGVRYVNVGLPGATADVMRKWAPDLVAADMEALKPDLVILGYGSNEGFDDNLDTESYRSRLAGSLSILRDSAPYAAWLFLGPADGAAKRESEGVSCGGGWHVPPKLAGVRDVMRDLAREMRAGYWDWSEAMGGPCSIQRWADQGLAAQDRVHLTQKGYDRSADALYEHLVAGYAKELQRVSAGAALSR